ncbi:hypothetical protein PISMIDRAFT_12635 [Pisolithus microcarpus 441]|uniref:Phosphofructokinase domain-containing protein n=1 Tax=Pisolithus microcarpus 441 TaxID=765257 RepID=A0A0C9YVP3_9AGAM|nr:hypothetical protein PISMIDRAFT_12635 [Pisolithus microcarpus 441]
MNTVVRAVVKAGILSGCETWIVREGYEGLVRGNTDTQIPSTIDESFADPSARQRVRNGKATNLVENLRFGDGDLLRDGTGDHARGRTLKGRYIVHAGWDDVRGWFADGGTSSVQRIQKHFAAQQVDFQRPTTLSRKASMLLFRSEWPSLIVTLHSEGKITNEQPSKHGHLRIVGLVGSIDNDMSMTDLTIGAPTALHRICEAIDNISPTAASHSRSWVDTADDFIFIPERPPQTDSWEDEMCEAISMVIPLLSVRSLSPITSLITAKWADARRSPMAATSNPFVQTMSGTFSPNASVSIHASLHSDISNAVGDRIEAGKAALETTPDTPSYMIGVRENKIKRVPLMEAVEMTRAVADAIAAKGFAKAMSLRDPEFCRVWKDS